MAPADDDVLLGVLGEAVTALMRLADVAKLRSEPLFAGLGFDRRSVGRLERVTWGDYCVLVERLEAALGGPAPFTDLIVRSCARTVPATLRTVLAAMVSPEKVYRFLCTASYPLIFPSADWFFSELTDGWVRVGFRLRPSARSCLSFSRGALADFRGATAHLGHPPAHAEVEELTDRSLATRLRLPRRSRDDAAARVATMARQLNLTGRQSEVFERLVRGLSNKEIGGELGCAESTVEIHVTQIFRKAGTQGRLQLIARVWAGEPGRP